MTKRRKKEKRLSMRKIREILRLSLRCNMGIREIAHSCSSSPSTVSGYINKALRADLSYEQIEQVSDGELIHLMKSKSVSNSKDLRTQPEWDYIHKELRKKSVTIQLLWEEYKNVHPDGYQLSQFYELYSRWKKKLSVSMRQTHKAGEKMFVDYAGQTIPVNDRRTGKIKEAQLFLAVLGASNYTYAECSWSQSLPDWIDSHIRSFEYFGGVTEIIVPDNLKSGVTTPCRYDPDINKTYHDLSLHYGASCRSKNLLRLAAISMSGVFGVKSSSTYLPVRFRLFYFSSLLKKISLTLATIFISARGSMERLLFQRV